MRRKVTKDTAVNYVSIVDCILGVEQHRIFKAVQKLPVEVTLWRYARDAL